MDIAEFDTGHFLLTWPDPPADEPNPTRPWMDPSHIQLCKTVVHLWLISTECKRGVTTVCTADCHAQQWVQCHHQLRPPVWRTSSRPPARFHHRSTVTAEQTATMTATHSTENNSGPPPERRFSFRSDLTASVCRVKR